MRPTLLVAIALLAGTTAVVAQTPVRPGLWSVTMQMEMPNMPVKMPEMKSTQCVTPEQAKDPAGTLPKGPDGPGPKQDCKVSDYKVSGNKATWKMVCTTPQAITSIGEMTFTDDTYVGSMKTSMPQGEMLMKVAGTRLGECTAK